MVFVKRWGFLPAFFCFNSFNYINMIKGVSMPYDKTVGGDDFTFKGTLTGNPSTLLDILDPADKQELLEALYTEGDITKPRIRTSVDGWIYSSSDFYTVHKIGGFAETIQANVRYPMPVYQWHRKRLFYGANGQEVVIRILLSASYDKRQDY
jgi:hypothetical protein